MFSECARARPDAVALTYRSTSLRYGELNARANRLARLLRAKGAGPETVVGVCLERPADFVLAELAVLKAGAAFLPLDPGYPPERLELMTSDAGAGLLVHAGRPPVQCIDGVDLAVDGQPAGPDEPDPDVPLPDRSLAYVIYTSGSTGRPKGVQVEHAQLAAMLRAAPALLELGHDSRCLQSTPFAFDMSVGLTLATLTTGGVLVLADSADAARPNLLAGLIREQRANIVTLPPSVLASLSDSDLAGVRTICAGGEACSVSLARRFGTAHRFVNAYGPTETTVVTTAHLWRADDSGHEVVPIGAALEFARVYLLGEDGRRVPAGQVGEMYIGGSGVARGYLGLPAVTAERFLPDPFAGTGGARMYRTGDLARELPGGELEFRGRTDHQVKIHGYRIELAEIERALEAHPEVSQAVVLVTDGQPAGQKLHAYVRCARQDAAAGLRAFLAERLPRYMIPQALAAVPAFPLTPNGKIDRDALATTHAQPAGQARPFVPATGSSERLIAEVWARALGVPQVGTLDTFSDLGGDSLAAGKIAERLRGLLGVELPLRVFFDGAVTVSGLAAAVESGEFTAAANPVPAIPRRIRRS